MVDEEMASSILNLLSTLGLGTFVGTAIGYEYRRYREAKREEKDVLEKWFDETLDVIGRGAYNISRARFRSDPDYEQILKELDGFSERLYLKARNPPEGAPESVVNEIGEVAQLYAKATLVAEVNSQKDGAELLAELFEMAQKEPYEEFDFQAVLDEAGNVSGGFSQVLKAANEQGIKTEDFAETIETIISEWSSEDFAYVMSMMSDGDAGVEEAVKQSLTLFLELAQNLSDRAYEVLESEKKNVV